MSMKKTAPVPATYRTPIFGSVRMLCVAALLTALSIVLGKYLAISTPLFRISFENLPILMAGIFFGPLIGGAVGAIADLVGCVLVGYAINPIITVGGVLVGVLSGLVSLLSTRNDRTLSPLKIFGAVAVAHIVGSMVVKTWGLSVYFHAPMETLIWRVPLYIAVGSAEGTVLCLMAKNRLFMSEMHRLQLRPVSRKGGNGQ